MNKNFSFVLVGYMTFTSLVTGAACLLCKPVAQKVIIWDLGNTLMRTHTMGIASEIGLKDFLLYSLLEWKNPFHIQNIVFSILDGLSKPQSGDAFSIATTQGRPLPTIMCDWLTGKQSGSQISYRACNLIKDYDKTGFFTSRRQKRLVEQAVKAMFDPEKLAKHTYSIKAGINLLRECAEQYDKYGNPRHKLYILSNWDTDSFRNLYNSYEFRKILDYVTPENIIISGDIGTLKPHSSIYEYFMKKAGIENPQDCILIDDQWENIVSARQSGMHGILLENRNYRKLKYELKEHHVLQ